MEKKYPKYYKNGMPNATQRASQASEAGVKLKRKRNIPEWKKKYGLTNEIIAEMFGYSNGNSFHASPRKSNILNGIEELIYLIEKKTK